MEQARYRMWVKRKPDSNPHNILAPMNSYGDSWEEQAFAEDAAGTLGGCVWPPRSYSCSFCRREFRSAQALGGHMNVHRRDRARLNQSPLPSTEVVPQNHALNTCTPQICTFLYNNPNSEFSDTRVLSLPATKVNNIEEKMTTLCFLPPLVHKNDVVSSNNPPSWSSFVAEKRDHRVLGSNKNELENKFKTIVDREDSRAEKEYCVTKDFPVSLNNLVVCRTRTNTSSNEEVASCKRRRRRNEENPSSFFPKVSAVDKCGAQSEVLRFFPGPAEELDLELRLGNAPKVK